MIQIVALELGKPDFLQATEDRINKDKLKPINISQGAHCAGLTGSKSIDCAVKSGELLNSLFITFSFLFTEA